MKISIIPLLGLICLVFAQSLFAEATPNPKSYRGGWVTKIVLPEPTKVIKWEKDEFALHVTFDVNKMGKVTKVSPVGHWLKEMPEWQQPFLESCMKALMQWSFSPQYEGDEKSQELLSGWGATLHFEYSKNSKGDMNLTIHRGVTKVLVNTGVFWRPE